jgi:hypothetical protein
LPGLTHEQLIGAGLVHNEQRPLGFEEPEERIENRSHRLPESCPDIRTAHDLGNGGNLSSELFFVIGEISGEHSCREQIGRSHYQTACLELPLKKGPPV